MYDYAQEFQALFTNISTILRYHSIKHQKNLINFPIFNNINQTDLYFYPTLELYFSINLSPIKRQQHKKLFH